MKTCADVDMPKSIEQVSFVLLEVDTCSPQIVSILSPEVKVFRSKNIKTVTLLILLMNLPLSHCIKFLLG